MPTKTTNPDAFETLMSSVAPKVGAANILAGLFGFILSSAFGEKSMVSFASGFILGMLNLYLVLKIIRKGLSMEYEKMAGFVMKRFYARYFFVVLSLFILVWQFKLNPLALMTGFAITIFTAVIALIFIMRGELEYA